MNNVQFNIAVMFIAGTVAIGCTANDQTPADQTKGGVAITDTSTVSGTIVQMGDGRTIAIRNPGQAQILVIEGRDVTPNSAPLGDARIMEERPTLSVGDIAPEFEAKRLNGSTFRLADYRGKKAVLIDFWATWCPPCVDEIPTIKRIAETYSNQELEVVGVSLDRDEQALRNFVKKEKLNYVQVFDQERARSITKSYGVWGIPSVFLVDKNGVINAMKLRGNRTEAAVKTLLDTN